MFPQISKFIIDSRNQRDQEYIERNRKGSSSSFWLPEILTKCDISERTIFFSSGKISLSQSFLENIGGWRKGLKDGKKIFTCVS